MKSVGPFLASCFPLGHDLKFCSRKQNYSRVKVGTSSSPSTLLIHTKFLSQQKGSSQGMKEGDEGFFAAWVDTALVGGVVPLAQEHKHNL